MFTVINHYKTFIVTFDIFVKINVLLLKLLFNRSW